MTAPVAMLRAAERYDGTDLAAESSRMMLTGPPTASHRQGRFSGG